MELKERVESKIKKNFTISYNDTEQNRSVKDTFLLFCDNETDGSYLQGIKKLLENYSADWKYEIFQSELQQMREEIANLKKQPVQEEKKVRSIKTFGG